MHGPECKADHCNARQCAADHRHQRQCQHTRGTVDEQQNRAHQQRPEDGEARCIPLDPGAAFHRKNAGPGDDHARTLLFLLYQRFLERGTNPRHGLFLRVDVEAGRTRLRDK